MIKILSLLLLMLLMFTAGCGTIASAENLLVYFLDVGQADAAILQCGDEVMMIDGGESSDSSLIYSYLTKTLGITHIDYMIATHPHADHIGGLSGALNACSVGVVYCKHLYSFVCPYVLFFSNGRSKCQGPAFLP